MKQSVVVVGGGTAGWLTALLVKQVLDCEVTVVSSSDIGVIGVGEGSTPQFVTATDFLGIGLSDLVRHTEATIKTGIRFDNWRGDNASYFHEFVPFDTLPSYAYSQAHWIEENTSITLLGATGFHGSVDQALLALVLAESNKVPVVPNNSEHGYAAMANMGLHFDAIRLGQFLAGVSERRGIGHVDGAILSIERNDRGDVTSLRLDDEREIDCDFVFDCSGFARVVISQMGSEWVSQAHRLPCDKAVTFRTPRLTPLPAMTSATAMLNGWRWTIPLRNTTGNGYVYSSHYADEETILQELKRDGVVPESYRAIDFETGYLRNPWINNCVAIGLAAGFVEPLEATSIWSTISSVARFVAQKSSLTEAGVVTKESYNKRQSNHFSEIVDFLELHYYTTRNDSPFWRDRQLSQEYSDLLQLWNERLPMYEDIPSECFGLESLVAVAMGGGVLAPDAFGRELDHHRFRSRIMDALKRMRLDYRHIEAEAFVHEAFLSFLEER